MKVIGTFLILFCLSFSTINANEGVNFSDESYETVLAQAKSQGKQILLDFTASWCIPCKKMDRETFSDIEVSTLLNNKFISLKVNVDYFWAMDIAEKYDIKGYPTILIINPSESVVKKLVGFKSSQEIIQALKYL